MLILNDLNKINFQYRQRSQSRPVYLCVRAADLFELHNLNTIPSEAFTKNRPHPVPIAIWIGTSHKTQDNSGSLRNPSSSNLVNKRGFVTL